MAKVKPFDVPLEVDEIAEEFFNEARKIATKHFVTKKNSKGVKHKISSSGKISRSDIIRAVWAYIKSEELQDENDGRVINLDEALKELFDTDKKSVKMTAMTSLYSNFILN